MSATRLIGVDWGTTSLRCYAVADDGTILARHESQNGILSVRDGNFAGVLARALAALEVAIGEAPVALSGMIGSRQGWFEAPYVHCPASRADIAAHLSRLETPLEQAVFLIPGLDTRSGDGIPDVIRGEETQIFGALAALGVDDGLFVLPGTHSKWVTVTGGKIQSFQTFMTGEVFTALKDHTILGRLISDQDADDSYFETGVGASASEGPPGRLLHQLFSARTLGLFDQLPGHGVAAYLSGLLIGSEVKAVAQSSDQPIYVIAGSTLTALYVRAAQSAGLQASAVDGHCIVRGYLDIARLAET